MIYLTTEQAQQIEEALMVATTPLAVDRQTVLKAMATIRAAKAQEQAEQEPVMDYERLNALRDGEQNGAEDAYFFVRPENDTPTLRKMFCQGFERGFHKGIKYSDPVEPVKQEPVALVFVNRHGDVEITDYTLWQLERGHYKLYTAPVRTKDLTGQDLCDLEIAVGWKGDSHDFEVIVKTVIAADRELNK